MAESPTEALVERDKECGELHAVVGRLHAGEGSLTIVEGPAGIGKTQLLAFAKKHARCLGARVLTSRAVELERDFPFGVVRQLFEPAMAGPRGDRERLLEGAAALAAPVLGVGEALPEPASASLQAVLHGLYWLTSNLAEQAPLLVAVDDAQWADPASLRFLCFLAPRLEDLAVALIVTLRCPDPDGTVELLDQLRSDALAQVLRPRPLSRQGVQQLVERGLGSDADEEFLVACGEVTGGNPFLVTKLVEELVGRGCEPTAAQLQRVRTLGSQSVGRAIVHRLRRLSPGALALAQSVAVLGDGAELSHAAELAGLDWNEACRALDLLVGAGVLEPAQPLRFLHSMLRSSVYGELTHTGRGERHRQAAALLERDGRPPEQVAAHLALTQPSGDPKVVEALRRAASRALARGTPEVATTYLRRALREPPPPERRSDVLIELCTAESRVPGTDTVEWLRQALEVTQDPAQRAAVALELAHVAGMIADTAGALDLLDRATEDLGSGDTALRRLLEAEFISVARLYPESRGQARERLARLRPHAQPGTLAGSLLLANLALDAVERIEPAQEAAALAQRALEDGLLLAEERWVFAYAANTLTWSDQVDAADRAWVAALTEARRRGSTTMFHLACIWRAHLAYRRGAVTEAEADARLGLNICRQHHWTFSWGYAAAFLVDALVERGDVVGASLLLEQVPDGDRLHYLLYSRGRLRCEQGQNREGLADLLECGRRLERSGEGDNPSVIPWRSSAALAALALDEVGKARDLCDSELALARTFGAGRALGMALRASALVATGDERVDRLREAADVLEKSPAVVEHARALADLGAALRRAGDRSQAAALLRTSLDLAHRCGASALRQRVQEELLASGLRPRRFAMSGVDALTPSERRVAEMAASGLANREIAQSLFVSLKTVEAHLASTYRKLNVSNRSKLSLVLEGQGRG